MAFPESGRLGWCQQKADMCIDDYRTSGLVPRLPHLGLLPSVAGGSLAFTQPGDKG
jgi:hypothetical protein